MQIEKTLINDRLLVSKVSWKLRIHPWNLLLSQKVAYFLTASIVFLFTNKTLLHNNFKTRTAINAKISVFVICVEAIIYLLLNNFHDCTFKGLQGRGRLKFRVGQTPKYLTTLGQNFKKPWFFARFYLIFPKTGQVPPFLQLLRVLRPLVDNLM